MFNSFIYTQEKNNFTHTKEKNNFIHTKETNKFFLITVLNNFDSFSQLKLLAHFLIFYIFKPDLNKLLY